MGHGGMKGIAKGILSTAGLQLQRVPRPREIDTTRRRPTHGLVVEFVGPAGIGKTTLFRHITHSLKKDWLFEHHTRAHAVPDLPASAFLTALEAVHFARMEHLRQTSTDVYRNICLIKRTCEIVDATILAVTQDYPRGFVFDEGIAHYFAEQIIALDDETAREILGPMALIFLLPAETGTLVGRRFGRGDGPDSPSARAQAEEELAVYRALLALCSRCGLSHLVLRAEDSVSVNAERALDYIAGLVQTGHRVGPAAAE
jgi:hypothetical protein